jgi:hypothetical protein
MAAKVHETLQGCIDHGEKSGKPWTVTFEGQTFYVWAINGREALSSVGVALGMKAEPIRADELVRRLKKKPATKKKVAK